MVVEHPVLQSFVGGITLANYVLQPGETQETRVQNTGVYIVNKKKVFVK